MNLCRIETGTKKELKKIMTCCKSLVIPINLFEIIIVHSVFLISQLKF